MRNISNLVGGYKWLLSTASAQIEKNRQFQRAIKLERDLISEQTEPVLVPAILNV